MWPGGNWPIFIWNIGNLTFFLTKPNLPRIFYVYTFKTFQLFIVILFISRRNHLQKIDLATLLPSIKLWDRWKWYGWIHPLFSKCSTQKFLVFPVLPICDGFSQLDVIMSKTSSSSPESIITPCSLWRRTNPNPVRGLYTKIHSSVPKNMSTWMSEPTLGERKWYAVTGTLCSIFYMLFFHVSRCRPPSAGLNIGMISIANTLALRLKHFHYKIRIQNACQQCGRLTNLITLAFWNQVKSIHLLVKGLKQKTMYTDNWNIKSIQHDQLTK